jgi:hypothetical protein
VATATLESQPIVDIVRRDPRLVVVLADLGITPRYLYWTVEDVARDLDINLAQLCRRLAAPLPNPPPTRPEDAQTAQ